MVNSGSPSKGCFLCRARKIKCDEAKPHCRRCQKSRRECPGYRDSFGINSYSTKWTPRTINNGGVDQESSVSFNIQNIFPSDTKTSPKCIREVSTAPQDIIIQSRANPPRNLSSFTEAMMINIPAIRVETLPPTTIPWSLNTPIEQQASCFFLSNYVLLSKSSTERGYLDFLIPLLKKTRPRDHLDLAFSAICLAAFGNRPGSGGGSPLSGKFYLEALNKIKAMIQDPKQAVEDSVLGSVILLSLFESNYPSNDALHLICDSEYSTSSTQRSNGWTSHIEGATALIKLRGNSQFETDIGRQMFIAVRDNMVIQAIVNSEAPVLGYTWWMTPKINHPVIQAASGLNFRFAELRSDAENIFDSRTRSVHNIESILCILQKAQAIEIEYQEWERTLPPSWHSTTIAWIEESRLDKDSAAYPGRLDTYSDLWMACVRNMARSTRIFASGLALRCTAWLYGPADYRTTPEYIAGAQLGTEIIAEIISSIPYHLGWKQQTTPSHIDLNTDNPGHANFACGENDSSSPKILAAMFCIWPLFAAASSDFCLEEQRKWLLGRLKFINETVGIQQASIWKDFQIRMPSIFILKDRSFPNNFPTANQVFERAVSLDTSTRHEATSCFEASSQVPVIPLATDSFDVYEVGKNLFSEIC